MDLFKFLSISDQVFKASNLWGYTLYPTASLSALHNNTGLQSFIHQFNTGRESGLCSDWARETHRLLKEG